jgi:hypothetical protein
MFTKNIKIYIILLIGLTIFLSLSQIIFDYIFQKEPYFYYGSFPIENENLKFAKNFPKEAKAVLSLEGNILKVYLPDNSNYFDLIFKDLKVFLYDTSVKLNKLVKPYFIDKKDLKPPKVYEKYIKIQGIGILIALFLSGRIFSLFNDKNMKIFLLHYYKEIFQRFIFFIFSIIIMLFLIWVVFKDIKFIYSFVFYSLASIFIASIFSNIYWNLMTITIFIALSMYADNIFYSLITLGISIIINFVFSIILL